MAGRCGTRWAGESGRSSSKTEAQAAQKRRRKTNISLHHAMPLP